jgi:hypothetical protein
MEQMSEQIIQLKKYGQVTKVIVEEQEAYVTAVTPKYEKQHIEILLMKLGIENVKVEILE